MNIKIVLAGVGGQGILFATKILSETAAGKGHNIIGSETHGMSQRGGSVTSYLKIGDYSSPLVMKGEADYIYGYDSDETIKNLSFLRPGGVCFADSTDADFSDDLNKWISDNNISVYKIPAGEIAMQLGSAKSANLVLLGFSAAHDSSPFTKSELVLTIKKVTPSRFFEANMRCFEEGYSAFKG